MNYLTVSAILQNAGTAPVHILTVPGVVYKGRASLANDDAVTVIVPDKVVYIGIKHIVAIIAPTP